jgi:hypothetical protein
MKDCTLANELVVHIGEVVVGAGTMDQGLILRRLAAACPGAWCIIEHLPDELVPRARAALCAAALDAGLTLEQ